MPALFQESFYAYAKRPEILLYHTFFWQFTMISVPFGMTTTDAAGPAQLRAISRAFCLLDPFQKESCGRSSAWLCAGTDFLYVGIDAQLVGQTQCLAWFQRVKAAFFWGQGGVGGVHLPGLRFRADKAALASAVPDHEEGKEGIGQVMDSGARGHMG